MSGRQKELTTHLRQSKRMSEVTEVIGKGLEEDVNTDWIPENRIASNGGDLYGQEPRQSIIVEEGCDPSAVPGAERRLNGVDGNTTSRVDETGHRLTSAAAGEVVKFTCEESGCQWYCQHHDHYNRNEDFSSRAEIFLSNAESGCPGCILWKDIAATRCACKLADSELDSFCPEPDSPKFVEVAFYPPPILPVVEVAWSCSRTKLEIAAPPDLDTSVSKFGGSVHLDRLSFECISLFQDWIRHCDTTHSSCARTKFSMAPRRLLEVGDPDRKGDIKLRCMKQESVKYLALSYCWGGSKPPQTTLENKSDHERGIAWSALPKSYADTILLARSLSIPYVWIDAYCIVQDDQEERDTEIGRMGEIFQNAYLVIVAASSPSPHVGYLANHRNVWADDGRARFKWRETLVRYGKFDVDTVRFREAVHQPGQGSDACAYMKIGKRAWTYQERLLAPRCLIFQGREVVWECKTSCLCECGGTQSRPGDYVSQLLPSPGGLLRDAKTGTINGRLFLDEEEAYQFWRDAIRAFARRELTYATDRLPAISALASIVHTATKDEYFAGLWKGDLIRQLMWHNRPSYDDLTPYDTYVAPSWSWASNPTPTGYYQYPKQYESLPCVRLVEANCVLSGVDPLGAVQDGYLLLHGVHCEAQAEISISKPDNWPHIKLNFDDGKIKESGGSHSEFSFLDGLRVHSVGMELVPGFRCSTLQRYHVSTSREQEICSGRVRLLWLEDDVCLLLAYSQRVRGAFERIGILDSDMSPSIPDDAPSTIKLV